MEAVRETQKKYCSRAMITAIVAACVFILAGQKGIGKGLVLGTLFSVFNFILMAATLPMRIGKSKGLTYMLSLGSVFFSIYLIGRTAYCGHQNGRLQSCCSHTGRFHGPARCCCGSFLSAC